MFDELIKLADQLDSQEYYVEADLVDNCIRILAQNYMTEILPAEDLANYLTAIKDRLMTQLISEMTELESMSSKEEVWSYLQAHPIVIKYPAD